jgi:hypothetical protein
MRSGGGSVLAGIEIGRIIRLRNYMTLVSDSASCASACAIAWLGGTTRYMAAKAKIGFHAAFNPETGQETGVGNALIGSYLSQIGLPDRAVIYATRASPQSMTWLTMSDAQEKGIEVSLFASTRDQPPTAEPRERDRKEAEPRPASVERLPSEFTRPNNEPRRIKTLTVRRDQPDGAAAPSLLLAPSSRPIEPPSLPIAPSIAPVTLSIPPGTPPVVLYDEDLSDPKAKQYVGSVIWRTEWNLNYRKPDIMVRADIEIPDRKFKMTMLFRRNPDTSRPASHFAELIFQPQDPGGGVDNVQGILMKPNRQTQGTPLAGLAIKVTHYRASSRRCWDPVRRSSNAPTSATRRLLPRSGRVRPAPRVRPPSCAKI